MRFYNIDMKGKFFVQRGTSLPATDPSNEGRLFYDETTQALSFHDAAGWNTLSVGGSGTYLRKDQDDSTLFDLTAATFKTTDGYYESDAAIVRIRTSDTDDYLYLSGSYFRYYVNGSYLFSISSAGAGVLNGGTIWTSANDGPGSNLNADFLDSQDGSYYTNAGNLNAGTVPVARLSGTYNISITGTARYA